MQYDRETFKQSNYSIGSRFDALLQHRISDHRKFLARRNAFDTHGFRAESRWVGRGQLCRDEVHDDEGWED